jgi:hypothetical protein
MTIPAMFAKSSICMTPIVIIITNRNICRSFKSLILNFKSKAISRSASTESDINDQFLFNLYQK